MEASLGLTLSQVIAVMQNRIMSQTTYFGISTLKSPIDFWVYQEILYESKADVIIEIGNYRGGCTLALAHLCDAMDHGRVIGIDVSHAGIDERVRSHKRVALIEGDACAKQQYRELLYDEHLVKQRKKCSELFPKERSQPA